MEQCKQRNWIALLVLLLGIGVMLYAGGRFKEKDEVYREGNMIYETLSERVRVGAAAGDGRQRDARQAAAGIGAEGVETPANDAGNNLYNNPKIDFAALKAINSDAAAWLYCPDTPIDYPVMRADDYDYYLSHLADGTLKANGALFIDYNNASDFSERLTVIYGHHMKSGRMFGGLKGYKNQQYFEDHPVMYLNTENQDYRVDLIYGCVIGAGEWSEYAFMYEENLEALLAYAAENTTFRSGASYAEGDRIVALSTCSYEFDDARYVVLGVLNPL